MFTINVDMLKTVVAQMKSAAQKLRMKDATVLFSANPEDNTVSFYLSGDKAQLKRVLSAEVKLEFSFITTLSEASLKVGVLPSDFEITVEKLEKKGKGKILFRWGGSSCLLLETLSKEIPIIDIPSIIETVSLPAGCMQGIARNFAYFCSLENSQAATSAPITLGVYFEKTANGTLRLQASNSIRTIRGVITDGSWFESNYSIHAETLHALAAFLPNGEDVTVSLSSSRLKLVFECGNSLAVVGLLDGHFPNMDDFFKDKNAKCIWRVDRLDFLQTARRIKAISPFDPVAKIERNKNEPFAIAAKIVERIGAVLESEEYLTFKVNMEQIEAALSVLRDEEVLFCFEGFNLPITIIGGDEDSGETNQIMIAQIEDVSTK